MFDGRNALCVDGWLTDFEWLIEGYEDGYSKWMEGR